MSDAQDRMFQTAYLLGVEVSEVRQAVSQARRAFPNEAEDRLLSIATEALRRIVQQRALDAARKSVGR